MSVLPLDRLRRRLPVINGRGACGHPDGAVGLEASSALAALTSGRARQREQHIVGGRCQPSPPVIPLDEPWEPGNSTPARRR